ncbi:MAG: hypothetical protein NVS1B13_10720 [Flavisolibacter sp.]
MIHLVFQHSDLGVLKTAMEMDQSLEGTIYEIKDDFAVGPLKDLQNPTGWDHRLLWWKSILSGSPHSQWPLADIDDRNVVEELKQRLLNAGQEFLWIWMGQNQHDVCGYFWLIPQLEDFLGRLVVLYLNNLPFINEKGQIFYPKAIHEILPKEILKAKKLNRKMTTGEFELDREEWVRLTKENAGVRILEGGKKIIGKDPDFYDTDILNCLNGTWLKANKAINHILGRMKIKTGDLYLWWRIRELVVQKKIEMNGDPAKGWKELEIRLSGVTGEQIPNSQDLQKTIVKDKI